MISKSQHIIPRLHLQHFVGHSPAGQVWNYDATTAKQWSAIPEETCVQTHFYSAELDDGTKDARIEEHLSKVESKAAPIYEGLLDGHIPLDPQARLDFANFLALMHTRTTVMRRMAAEIRGRGLQIHSYAVAKNQKSFDTLVRLTEEEKGEKMPPEVRKKIRELMINPKGYNMEVSKESTLMVLGASDHLTPILYKMKWSLVVAKNGYFITSDNPLVRQVDVKSIHPLYGDHGFENNTAEVTFPLSPKRLLLLSWNDSASDIAFAGQEHVLQSNLARAANSDRFLYAHINDKRIAKLANKFKDSRPGITTQGFGPEEFMPIKVMRRFNAEK